MGFAILESYTFKNVTKWLVIHFVKGAHTETRCPESTN